MEYDENQMTMMNNKFVLAKEDDASCLLLVVHMNGIIIPDRVIPI